MPREDPGAGAGAAFDVLARGRAVDTGSREEQDRPLKAQDASTCRAE